MINDKTILVTGGTGSFGKTFVKKLLIRYNPKKVIVFSRDEAKQHFMRTEYKNLICPTDEIIYNNFQEKLDFRIGDVRDYDSLVSVVQEADIVVNAAALKQVPSCEYFPLEAIKTNCLGVANLIKAINITKNNVKVCIGISTDKACLDFHSPVELTDGTTMKISDIVRDNKKLEVKTFNEENEEFTSSNISGWYKNKLNKRKMIGVSYENGFIHGKYKRRVLCTEDHEILTKNGWVEAKNIKNGDLILTNEYMPNDNQLCVLLGTVLGDSSLKKTGNRVCLVMGHCKKQEDWLNLKIKYLNIEIGNKTTSIKNKKFEFIRMLSKSSAFLTDIYDSIYVNGKKRIPKDLFEYCFNHNKKLLLSTLLQDDGCITDGLIRLATHGFEKEDVEWLVEFLSKNGYESYVYDCKYKNKTYPETRFNKNGSDKLKEDLFGYFIMDYKINKNGSFDSGCWEPQKNGIYYGRAIIENYDYVSKDVYCVDVDNTHNFVVNNIVVHNCKPTNVMGMTKALQEKLFIAANINSECRFTCVRYGNVLASRGSVIPFFHEQIRNGKDLTVTHVDMTRFLMSLEDSVDLVLDAINYGGRGETLIPITCSARMIDLASVLKEANEYKGKVVITGIRPGEKLHEELISEEESGRTYHDEEINRYIIFPMLPELSDVTNHNQIKSYSSKYVPLTVSALKMLLDKKGLLYINDKQKGEMLC